MWISPQGTHLGLKVLSNLIQGDAAISISKVLNRKLTPRISVHAHP